MADSWGAVPSAAPLSKDLAASQALTYET